MKGIRKGGNYAARAYTLLRGEAVVVDGNDNLRKN